MDTEKVEYTGSMRDPRHDDNPYLPPSPTADEQQRRLRVRYFPLCIEGEWPVRVSEPAIHRWAERFGFQVRREAPGEWLLWRGFGWRSWFTFDIREVPTTVRLSKLATGDNAYLLRFLCRQIASVAAPGDPRTLQGELEWLESEP